MSSLTGGRILARNVVVNFFGSGAPLLVALVAIPLLIRGMGTDRFGILTVAWVVIGYFGFFDLGLGRALTKMVAERLGTDREGEIPSLVWTTLVLMLLLGVVGAVVLALLAQPTVTSVLKIPEALREEALHSFYLLAFCLPWVISTAGLRGLLEANQSFGLVNAIRVPMGLLAYVGPLLVLPFSSSLTAVTAALVVGRILGWVAHVVACLRVFPALRERTAVHWSGLGALARFGSWITLSNVVSPLMTYMDRFLVGALISMAAVAYYVTPYEMVIKFGLVPYALMGVFFPAFAATFATDRSRTILLFDRAVRTIFLFVFPITLVIVTLAYEGLHLWLGREFAENSTLVLQWLAVGVFVNCLAQVPFAMVQGGGRPDIAGKLHMVELPLYALAIWLLSRSMGIVGVAVGWTLRVVVDAAVLFVATERILPTGRRMLREVGVMTAASLLVIVAGFLLPDRLALKLAFLAVAVPAFCVVAWRRVLSPADREMIREWLASRRAPPAHPDRAEPPLVELDGSRPLERTG